MDPVTVGILGCVLLVILLFLGMPIAFVMMFVGFTGLWALSSLDAALPKLAETVWGVANNYPYTIIPLFILMGSFAGSGGITRELYNTFDKWARRLPGGLGIATIAACAAFGAVSGSSVAAAAAMGNVALPEMRRFGYDPKLGCGVIAAGGTLSFLIPPSLGFVVYGMLTEQSIGKLLISGILPGALMAAAFIACVVTLVGINPKLA
ncbi:MAG TPA: TRAP transporter large permease subunit, partial [Syntrophorhabdaceae bacterium]|nr:TRAP transporter large permease subunit [Syntrophorhabdaceae bacterium]